MAAMARLDQQEGLIPKEEEVAQILIIKDKDRHPFALGAANTSVTGSIISCLPHDCSGTFTSTYSNIPYMMYRFDAKILSGDVVWDKQDAYLCLEDGFVFTILRQEEDIDFLISHMDFLVASRYNSQTEGERALLCGGLNAFSMSMHQSMGTTSITRGTVGAVSGISETTLRVATKGEDDGKAVDMSCVEEECSSLIVSLYNAMNFITPSDVEGVKEILLRIERMPRGGVATYKGDTYQIKGTLVRPKIPVPQEYKSPVMAFVAGMHPDHRVVFFNDLRKMPNKVFDYVICKAISAAHSNHFFNQPQLVDKPIPSSLSSTPEWASERDIFFETFLEANRNHPKKYWSDLFPGSYCKGFLYPKPEELFPGILHRIGQGNGLPKSWGDQSLMLAFFQKKTEKASLLDSIISDSDDGYLRVSGVFEDLDRCDYHNFVEFPKLHRYDMTPLQAAAMYCLMLEKNDNRVREVIPGGIDVFNNYTWLWSASAEKVLFKFIFEENNNAEEERWLSPKKAMSSMLKRGIQSFQSYVNDGIRMYNQYGERHGMLPLRGEAHKMLEISAYNHGQERNVRLEDKLRILGTSGKLLEKHCVLDSRVDKYRVLTREELVYLGEKLHHCVGGNSDRDALFFCHGTVVVKTDGRFSRITECRDAWNKITRKSNSFRKFMEKAIAIYQAGVSLNLENKEREKLPTVFQEREGQGVIGIHQEDQNDYAVVPGYLQGNYFLDSSINATGSLSVNTKEYQAYLVDQVRLLGKNFKIWRKRDNA
jgi:hypothetical protein